MPASNPLLPWAQRCAAWVVAGALSACAAVPVDQRLLLPRPDGDVATLTQACGSPRPALPAPGALAARPLRLASWNVHKGEDAGWQTDLAAYAAGHDLLLLQEAVLTAEMRAVVEAAGHRWGMTGAFAQGGVERGVMIAARADPLDLCTLRNFEPLYPLPKTALVARYRLQAQDQTVAVANLHGVNFSLGLGRFTEQMEAVVAELAQHVGPIILGGDFNTWSEERHDRLLAIVQRLGLTAVDVKPDGRRRIFGRAIDHLFVRGWVVVRAESPAVRSSDHNPILVELQLR